MKKASAAPKALPSKGAVSIPANKNQFIGGLVLLIEHFLQTMGRTTTPTFKQKLESLLDRQSPFVRQQIASFGL